MIMLCARSIGEALGELIMCAKNNSIAIFWDIENCAPPRKMRGTSVETKLRQGLAERGPIKQILAYADLDKFPTKLRIELQRSGVHLIDTPRERHSKDVADHMIITDMLIFAMENSAPQTIVLISGDIDYAYSLAKLQQRGYKVILITPPVGAHPDLKEQADIILEWTDIMGLKEERIENGDLALSYEPLLSTIRELGEAGVIQPTRSEVEAHLTVRYPGWKQTSGYENYDEYIENAEQNRRIKSITVDNQPRIIVVSEEKALIEQERFDSLLSILREAIQSGNPEPEMAWIGVRLRSMISNPYEHLGVRRLKDYILEAETEGLVRIRQEGLQHYVSLIDQEIVTRQIADEERETLDLLERALETLKDDQILPTEQVIIARMRALKPKWSLKSSCFGAIENLLNAALVHRGIQIEGKAPKRVIFSRSGKFEAIDPDDSSHDPFSEEEWQSLEHFLKEHPDIVARGRYTFAKRLQEEALTELSQLRLGQLLLLVQLAINRGWLQFHNWTLRASSDFQPKED